MADASCLLILGFYIGNFKIAGLAQALYAEMACFFNVPFRATGICILHSVEFNRTSMKTSCLRLSWLS